MLLLLRAYFSFCQLPLLEITSNLALLCSNSHQTNPNSTPHTLIMDLNSTTTSSSMPHNTTESVTFDSVAERIPSSTVQVTGCYSCDVFCLVITVVPYLGQITKHLLPPHQTNIYENLLDFSDERRKIKAKVINVMKYEIERKMNWKWNGSTSK
ncbi:uncharacterized protein LOC108330112 [Vigna angularis]|uniref:uncharacterized protein LOC108330112 n=1 Tax=Phaseolus angularis TaxID=3914 RepID=UPI000809A3E0|nr:uncharacterized protein LOC108330112 [Vigna angularis]